MGLTRRQFISGAGASLATWPVLSRAQSAPDGRRVFRHGVASGDPLTDRIVLWTRVTPGAVPAGPIDVRWRIATDESLAGVVGRGTVQAGADRDFTVKIDASHLRPGRTYYFGFDAAGEASPVGRARTLPAAGASRMRIAAVSCANFPSGFYNAYRRVADRADLDAVLFLGDYIYEYANGVYGDAKIGRNPRPAHECVSLDDYRLRYASYREDPDLQAVHARHPCIAIWDDHELANDAWSGGAQNHDAGEGDWSVRRAAAQRAFFEWIPVREARSGPTRLYRTFAFGGLADVLMLDGRTFRDEQVPTSDYATIASPARTMLGAAQESWLYGELRRSSRAGVPWRILGQQVLLAPFAPLGSPTAPVDMWESYPTARERLFDCLERDRVSDVAVLSGDIHSSWALDVPRSPLSGYDPVTGRGSLAVEFVTPAITSPPFFTRAGTRERMPSFQSAAPHLKYLDGDEHGYTVLDISRSEVRAEWYHVRTITERTADERKAASFVCERGSSRLVPA